MQILDIYVPRPAEQWVIGNREYCVKRARFQQHRWYELHWAWEHPSGVTHFTKKFPTLGELYEWAEQQRVGPERMQVSLGI